MELPNNDNLKARITSENPIQKRRLESVKTSLKLAHELVAKAHTKSHQNNKKLYFRRAKVATSKKTIWFTCTKLPKNLV